MKVHQLPVGPFEMNCYIVADAASKDCFIIDAGDEPEEIIGVIDANKYNPISMINTHGHIDHARRAYEVQKHFNIPFYMGEKDLPLLETIKKQGVAFGLDVNGLPEVESFLTDGQILNLGAITFTAIHTPGHSPGSISYHSPGHLFVGDVLFKNSIGRTDLYKGDYQTLMNSIIDKLLILPDDTIVYSGHGPTTTIGQEKEHNPYLNSVGN